MCKATVHGCTHPCAGIDLLAGLWAESAIEKSAGVSFPKARVTVIVDMMTDPVVDVFADGIFGVGTDMALYIGNVGVTILEVILELILELILTTGASTAIAVVGVGMWIDALANMLSGNTTGVLSGMIVDILVGVDVTVLLSVSTASELTLLLASLEE